MKPSTDLSSFKKPNLYSSVWLAIMDGTEAHVREAQDLTNARLDLDPTDPEAVLSWTMLQLVHDRLDEANQRVAPLVKDFPDNPYFLMAATEIVFQRDNLSDDEVLNFLKNIEALARKSDDLADALAKLGCMATMRGFWSYGIRLFVDALREREQHKRSGEEDLIPLWKRNKPSLDALLDSLPAMDQRGLKPYDLDDLPLSTVARAFYILFTANLAGIDEAWPPCIRIADYRHEIEAAWTKKEIPSFLATHCSNWFIYQAAGSDVQTTPFHAN